MTIAASRRQFLVHAGCGVLSGAAFLTVLGRFGLIQALAQSSAPTDYKALVCVFLFGGNDANNVVIPYTSYADYDRVRGTSSIAISQADLLLINPPSTGWLTFGFHPSFRDGFVSGTAMSPSLNDLLAQQKMAAVCNVGPLIRPLTRADYRAGLARPYQLFSHADQQNLWQTAYASLPRQTGWGGLMADRTEGISGTGQFPVIASISGVTVFSTGQDARPLVLAPAPTALNATLKLLKTDDRDALLRALTADGDAGMPALIQGAARITSQALAASNLLTDDPLVRTFPNTSLGNQLKQVAKLMSRAPQLGLTRQIFFTSLGGFDTHTNPGNIVGTPANLLRQVSQAVGTFYSAMVDLGVSNKVTTFTASDFSRTFVPGGGGTGTDHAWGAHQFVIGDAVRGGDFYGTYPDLTLGAGWIPTPDPGLGGGGFRRPRWINTPPQSPTGTAWRSATARWCFQTSHSSRRQSSRSCARRRWRSRPPAADSADAVLRVWP